MPKTYTVKITSQAEEQIQHHQNHSNSTHINT